MYVVTGAHRTARRAIRDLATWRGLLVVYPGSDRPEHVESMSGANLPRVSSNVEHLDLALACEIDGFGQQPSGLLRGMKAH
jgi:hypothetical protein